MISLGENVLAVYDVETTGTEPGYHEVIQIAVVPLEPISLQPNPRYAPFYSCICPKYIQRIMPDAMRAHKIPLDELQKYPDHETVGESLREWFLSMQLPVGKRIIPIAHNLVFDQPMVSALLGERMYEEIFSRNGRCTLQAAEYINLRETYAGRAAPFNKMSLTYLCKHFGITLDGAHDALADCLATAAVFRELLKLQ